MSEVIGIGERIRSLREARKETQADVAQALNVKRETVNQWEQQTRDLKTVHSIALADHFNTTCDYLLRGVETENVDVNKATGLTEHAIKNLKEILRGGLGDFPDAEIVNKFLSNRSLFVWFREISEYVRLSKIKRTAEDMIKDSYKYKDITDKAALNPGLFLLDHEELQEFLVFKMQHSLTGMLKALEDEA